MSCPKPKASSANTNLMVYTINANGLNSPWKRRALLQELKLKKIQIALIQETHYKTNQTPKWYDKQYSTIIHSTPQSTKVRGTAIILANSLQLEIIATKIDPQGNYTFLKGKLNSAMYTFASIYLPNKDQTNTMNEIHDLLLLFAEGTLIVGGDLNTPLEPKLDCSSGTSSLPFKQIKKLKQQLHSLQLIDYIFISHKALDNVQKATIGSITWSDHAPVCLDISLNYPDNKHFSWKINDSLLKNPSVLETLTNATKDYFKNNTNTASNAIIEWEAYKCFIRGIAIQQGAKLKRERAKKKQDLLLHIKKLELSHKTFRTPESLADLIIARQELKSLLQTETDRATFFMRKMFYDHGNKCSRPLARMLKTKEQKNHIFKMKSPNGQIQESPKEIQKILIDFYKKLYQIKKQNTSPTISDNFRYNITSFSLMS
uniref:Endonuclease/exonuclease/phosphatase domain-containing protein n=1 Tax=Xenopus tropicalis TaxID=8364 RepID=A0A803K4M8_XENTR